jgi:O-methyltransferase involved in polyketide biosynthesis
MSTTKIAFDSRSAIAETLLIPVFARAMDMQQSEPLLGDETAAALVARLDYDFGHIKLRPNDWAAILIRARQIDRWTAGFLNAHPGAVVVHIGCGLDTRFERVDDGCVAWYDLDLPEVIALRRELLPERSRCKELACSVFDPAWIENVGSTGQPTLLVAEGVLPYFEETQVKKLMGMLQQHFPAAELISDAMTPFFVRLKNLELVGSKLEARLHWGLKHGRDMERWNPGIRLLKEWFYFDDPEPLLRSWQWMRYFPPLGRGIGVFHYRLGNSTGN